MTPPGEDREGEMLKESDPDDLPFLSTVIAKAPLPEILSSEAQAESSEQIRRSVMELHSVVS
ncbi:MAG: hypothetical protein ACYCTV_03435 [Leptospirales bacterium]